MSEMSFYLVRDMLVRIGVLSNGGERRKVRVNVIEMRLILNLFCCIVIGIKL
jgi:hypothetical protein